MFGTSLEEIMKELFIGNEQFYLIFKGLLDKFKNLSFTKYYSF